MFYAVPLIALYKVQGVIISVYLTQIFITIVTVWFYFKHRKKENVINA